MSPFFNDVSLIDLNGFWFKILVYTHIGGWVFIQTKFTQPHTILRIYRIWRKCTVYFWIVFCVKCMFYNSQHKANMAYWMWGGIPPQFTLITRNINHTHQSLKKQNNLRMRMHYQYVLCPSIYDEQNSKEQHRPRTEILNDSVWVFEEEERS